MKRTILLTAAILAATKLFPRAGRATAWLLAVTGAWTALAVFFPVERLIAGYYDYPACRCASEIIRAHAEQADRD